MITSINQFLSNSGKSMKRSAIREILKHLQKPGMISFAGGLPAPCALTSSFQIRKRLKQRLKDFQI
jgi:hypothetical protein